MPHRASRRIGIVFSGGGTRGLAHVGVLRALLEAGIEPDPVAGTSAGAIVGALYAAGYSPAEMLEFFEQRSPFQVSKLALSGPGFIDTTKVVSDFEDYFPDDRFEALDRELRITATDLLDGSPVVFDSGPLIHAILASCSVPVVFTPTALDDRLFADGGILNNFPADLIDDRCDAMIGVYASPPRRIERSDIGSSLTVLQRALEVGMYHQSESKFDRCDVMISPADLSRFGVFDTKNLERIEAAGYRAALDAMAAIRQAVSGAGPETT